MSYKVDRVAQLENALDRGRFASVASLRSAGVTARQHNQNTTSSEPAKKAAAKKTAAKKPAVKSVATKAAKKS